MSKHLTINKWPPPTHQVLSGICDVIGPQSITCHLYSHWQSKRWVISMWSQNQ